MKDKSEICSDTNVIISIIANDDKLKETRSLEDIEE